MLRRAGNDRRGFAGGSLWICACGFASVQRHRAMTRTTRLPRQDHSSLCTSAALGGHHCFTAKRTLEDRIGDGINGDGAKTQKRLAKFQFCEGSVRGRLWPGKNTSGRSAAPPAPKCPTRGRPASGPPGATERRNYCMLRGRWKSRNMHL